MKKKYDEIGYKFITNTIKNIKQYYLEEIVCMSGKKPVFDITVIYKGDDIVKYDCDYPSDKLSVYVSFKSIGPIYLELKPTMGEEYPSVLRQIKNKNLLTSAKCKCNNLHVEAIVNKYMGTVTNKQQMKDVFKKHKIKLRFLEDIDTLC